MKASLFLFVTVFFLTQLHAQMTMNLKGVYIKSGQKVELLNINYSSSGYGPEINMQTNNEIKVVGNSELKKINFEITNLEEFWKNQTLFSDAYENFSKYGMQYDLRQEWENEAITYLSELEEKQLIFEDSFLENYLYSLTYKLYPGSIKDGRPGILNLKIMIDSSPNAFVFPNGSMIITTGLLSTINSEEELIGVMAHEISHFVLDHSTININKAAQRQKAAEFWAAFATTVAAASEIYVSSRNSYYVPGALTYGTAILASSIANSFTERLGLKYSREQEYAADNCAVELMKFLEIDPTALSSALTKIKHYCTITGNYYSISGNGDHPNISERITKIGQPNVFNSIEYDKLVSFVTSSNAIIEFNNRHFDACQSLVDRNIRANVAIEDDFVIKAMTNLYLYDNIEKNTESLVLINRAKNLNVSPTINLDKQEALVLLRLSKYKEALAALSSYNDKLDQKLNSMDNIKNENYWFRLNQYFKDEKDWTSKMIYKVKTM